MMASSGEPARRLGDRAGNSDRERIVPRQRDDAGLGRMLVDIVAAAVAPDPALAPPPGGDLAPTGVEGRLGHDGRVDSCVVIYTRSAGPSMRSARTIGASPQHRAR